MLVRRMVDLAGRDVAAVRFHLEAGVCLGSEQVDALVLSVGRDRELVVDELLRLHHR